MTKKINSICFFAFITICISQLAIPSQPEQPNVAVTYIPEMLRTIKQTKIIFKKIQQELQKSEADAKAMNAENQDASTASSLVALSRSLHRRNAIAMYHLNEYTTIAEPALRKQFAHVVAHKCTNPECCNPEKQKAYQYRQRYLLKQIFDLERKNSQLKQKFKKLMSQQEADQASK